MDGPNQLSSPENNRFRVKRVNTNSFRSRESASTLGIESAIPEVDEGGSSSSSYNSTATTKSLQSDSFNYFTPNFGSNVENRSTRFQNIASHFQRSNSSNMASGAVRKISSGVNPNVRRKSSVFLPDISEFAGQENGTHGNYGRSLHNYTHDALPKMNNYRNMLSIQAAQRPTLDELHEGGIIQRQEPTAEAVEAQSLAVKFGWIEGCLVRCLLNIWGVMLFLRLSWMVAQAGLIHSMIIIVISTLVTGITTLSMSALSTNGEIKGGGLYYMVSRSLGPEFGGAVGIVFSFANAGMAALNTVGFSESMIALLKSQDLSIVDGAQNDNRIISCIAIIVLQAIIVVGLEWEAKAQMGLLVILLVSMLDFVVGAFMGPQNDESIARGWIGLNGTLFVNNLAPGYRDSEGIPQDFFTVFSIFFPAVAGIQAGASISGDLKDPGSAIPKGTLLAIFITSASYALFAILAGAGTVREATGNITQVADWSFTNCTDVSCKWGLYNDYQVMQLMSAVGPIIYAGCFAATLSSALSCMVSGAKTFQALCKDEVYPYLTRFGIGYTAADAPYWSYGLGFIIALVFILIADLNAIAPLISNFFMAAYTLLNYCTFHASLQNKIGFRPTFKYYSTWTSLLGALFCIIVMFLMSWITALISIGCTIACYAIVLYRKPDLPAWGTSTQAQEYSNALTALQSLSSQSDHVKNYRPQILCLSGFPSSRPALIDFAYLLTKNTSLLICGNVQEDRVPSRIRKVVIQNGYDWLQSKKIKAFYAMVDGCKFDEGCQALLQSVGIGKLAPNILLMGYKTNWQICDREEVKEYVNCLHQALDNYLAISILRIKESLDCSHLQGGLEENIHTQHNTVKTELTSGTVNMGFDPIMENETPTSEENANKLSNELELAPAKRRGNKVTFGAKGLKKKNEETGVYRQTDGVGSPKNSVGIFHAKQGKGTIDVWWLYDDGGLTLLLPYIIQMRKNWVQCRLRVFVLANKETEMELEYRGMASLLSKFRIDYSDLTVIPNITKRAEDKTRALFETLIKDFKGDPDKCDDPETIICDSELLGLKEKSNRHLRLRELLEEHSSKSNLVVMTLPVPRKGTVSAPLYMAWLEILTHNMPPFLLVRGNQTSVLTFYS